MPKIYTAPARIASVAESNSGAAYDSNPYSYYTGNSLSFTFVGSPSIDTVFAITEGGTSLSAGSLTSTGNDTYMLPGSTISRRAYLATGTASSLSSVTLTVTGATKIYHVLFMKHLLDLNQTDSRVITSYEVTAGTRNTFIQEDLYGRRTVQSGHISNLKKRIQYQIWQSGTNLTASRNEVNEFYSIVEQNPNITIWDLDEPGAQDYESIFASYWVPDSFSESIEGQQVINYGFAIEQQ